MAKMGRHLRSRKLIFMSASAHVARKPLSGPVLVAGGLLLAMAAWFLPVNLKSVSPALLHAAGQGTPSLTDLGRELVDNEKIGPASTVLAAARTVGDPRAPELAQALARLTAREPTVVAWGGWDPFLDPLFKLSQPSGHTASTPVLTFFIPQKARDALRTSLASSGSMGVQAILRTRELGATGRFVPANRPGGQPLDALILLTALLYQGERLSPSLQREVHALADAAIARNDLGDLGSFFLDLLALGRRLDWTQLSELLRRTDSTKTVSEYAQLARAAPDQYSLIYAAALFSDSADRVADYLLQYGKSGADDLRLALSYGQGAVRQLLARQVPVNRTSTPTLSRTAGLVLAHPQLMLAVKYLGYILGLFILLRGFDRWVVAPPGSEEKRGGLRHARAGILAVFLAGLFIVATEPFLLRAASSTEYQFHVRLPMLSATGTPPISSQSPTIATMNTSTVVSIIVFALVQVMMYFICLQKMNQIAQQALPPHLKLRLMENEENLFDSGLYVGMMGTAAALVLQVIGVIEPNLLAAYASNLFGIVCVALVKIRHVRKFKRQLILEQEAAASAA